MMCRRGMWCVCDTLQHTLPRTATHCNKHCNTHCNTQWRVVEGCDGCASRCNTHYNALINYHTLQYTITCRRGMWCVGAGSRRVGSCIVPPVSAATRSNGHNTSMYMRTCDVTRWTHCNTLQHTATWFFQVHIQTVYTFMYIRTCDVTCWPHLRCDVLATLQHAATYCNTLQYTAKRFVRDKRDKRVFIHVNSYLSCDVLTTLQHTGTYWNILQHTATRFLQDKRNGRVYIYI